MDGDHALQKRLLLGFIECYQDLTQRLDALLKLGITSEAIELIHAVKGVASNLSAIALTEASRRLLDELRSDAPLISRAGFDVILVETLKQMQQHVSDYVQPARIKAEARNPISLKETLLSLEPFIIGQEIIPDALLVLLQQLTDINLPYFLLVRELEHQIVNFEHQAALATFNLLKTKYLICCCCF